MSTVFRVILEGEQEVPPRATTASGVGTVIFDSAAVAASYSFDVQGLDFGPATGQTPTPDTDVTRTHFHTAAAGVNGPIVFGQIDTVDPRFEQDNNDLAVVLDADGSSWTVSGVWEQTDPADPINGVKITDFADDLGSATVGTAVDLYFNVHSGDFPGGEIRGQLVAIADDIDDVVIGTNPTEGDDGDDELAGLGGNDAILGLAGNDSLNGGNGNDVLDGGGDDDTLTGGNGNDMLFGSFGMDTLIGGNGDNSLDGGAGDDVLDGSRGEDIVNGGTGNDFLTGGQGDDTLQFGLASGTDTITDFKVGNDHIQLLDDLTLASTSGVVSDVNGDDILDTTLTLEDGDGALQGTVQVLGVSDVADWSALLVA